MKNIIKSFAALAASLLAFNACQNELAPVEQVRSTHKVTFVADSPATKTSYEVNGNVVDYSWSLTDQTDHTTGEGKRPEKFQVFENGIAATSINAVLVDGQMVIEAEFADTEAETFEYQALFNAGVCANQSSTDESYDDYSDVLISNILTDKGNLVFSFKREVAMATVTLKGLEKGATLLNVKIESNKPLAGLYNKDTHEWESTSTTLSIDSYNEIAAGVVALRFITIPVEDAMLKVTVQTTDDLDNVAATYVKEFTKPISFARGDVRPFNANLDGCEVPTEKPLYNKITRASEIEDGTYVICAKHKDVASLYYLENTKKAQPSFIAFDGEHISIADDNSTIDVIDATNATWTIEAVDGGYSITSTAGDYALATTTVNDGLTTQSTYVGKPWTIEEDDTYNWSFKYNDTNRYLCLYTLANPRTYDAKTTNANGVFFLYKLSDPREKLSTPANLSVNSETKAITWDSVSNAGSYELTIGNNDPINVNTNSYDASALADDYYDIQVVALPSNTERYKNSDAAVLENAVFGTPTLADPILSEGTITETSITVNWTVDPRATSGYHCEIYHSDTKVTEKDVNEGAVTFDSLTDGQEYSVRVNAKAVTGSKSYAASNVQSINVSTKAAVHVGDITSAGTYTVLGLTVYGVANNSTAIVGDATGYILFYKSGHGLKVGDTFDAAGSVEDYFGIWEFKDASITNKDGGDTPSYGEATVADDAYLTAYKTTPSIVYIRARGHQEGQDITVGSNTIHLSAKNDATDGMDVEVYGLAYGYHSVNDYIQLVATSITEDPTLPKLSISPDPASKTWAHNETDRYTVTVNAQNGDWTISPSSLTWATVEENHSTNTVVITPNGNNSSEDDYSATITVSHSVDPSLQKTIKLKQLKDTGSSITKGKSYSWALASNSKFSAWDTKTTVNKVGWTPIKTSVNGNPTVGNFDSARGQQFGAASNNQMKTLTIKGSDYATYCEDNTAKGITNLKIALCAKSGNTVTPTAKVGGVTLKATTESATISGSTADSVVTFEFTSDTPLDGEIEFTISISSAGAIYVKSIAINN